MAARIRRREFLVTLGGISVAWPLAARAQQPSMPVVGFLNPGSLESRRHLLAPFLRGLRETGYIEGGNVTIEYRWAEEQHNRFPMLAAELVSRNVAVLAVTGNTGLVLAAKAASKTIPIVFLIGSDPVKVGLVASLAHPGGNITGVSILALAVAAKRLELLHELVPAVTEVGFLVNLPNPYSEEETSEVQIAARALGLQVHILNATNDREIETAFTTLVQQKMGALLVGGDPLFNTNRGQLVSLAARHAVPAIYQYRESAAIGGLMSYGTNLLEANHQVGIYVGRILKGEKPADLPVQQSTKIELVVNMKTAKALGLTIPLPLLGRADEVIE